MTEYVSLSVSERYYWMLSIDFREYLGGLGQETVDWILGRMTELNLITGIFFHSVCPSGLGCSACIFDACIGWGLVSRLGMNFLFSVRFLAQTR